MTNRPNDLGVTQPRYGDWSQERLLGSGAFGNVYMWKNLVTGEEIAIKKCKNATGDMMSRWQTEMRLIKDMNHSNIVSFIAIPEALNKEYPKQYSLGMEYCSLGDLRKLMARAEYCCGLPEHHVKDVLGDIGSAIHYLHQQNNMHRDLKPENIVLKPKPDYPGRYQFKVTDLGYAKDLDNSMHSFAISFVGTLPYLAPELVFGQEHNPSSKPHYHSQVDYWSFGLVIFECITGYRPFFQHNTIPPMQALHLVKDKRDEDICAWLLPNTHEKHFCDHIPSPHSLNEYFARDVVKWLQLMLRVDGKRRGGVGGKEWYTLLTDTILPKKYVRVLNVSNMKLLTFEISENSFLRSVHVEIEKETIIPISQQLLVFETGKIPISTKRLLDQLREVNPHSPEYAVIYLFNKSDRESQHYIAEIPQQIQQYIANTNIERSEKDEKHILKITLNDVISKVRTGIMFHNAFCSLLGVVGTFSSSLEEKLKEFTEKTYKIEGKLEFFAESLKTDVEENAAQDNSAGICVNENFKQDCDKILQDIEEKKKQLRVGHQIIREAQQNIRNSSHYSAFNNDLKDMNDRLQAKKTESMEFYDNFRRECKRMEKSHGKSPTNHHDLGTRLKLHRKSQLQTLINAHWKVVHKYVQDILNNQKKFFKAMRSFVKCHTALQETLFKIQNKSMEYGCLLSEVQEKQKSRQHSLWNMLQHMKDVYNLANEHDVDYDLRYSVNQEGLRLQNLMDDLTEDPDVSFLLNPHQLLQTNDLGHSSGDTIPVENQHNNPQVNEILTNQDSQSQHPAVQNTISSQSSLPCHPSTVQNNLLPENLLPV
ncbi:inhibitor of nuclear factor kappa-B kinase subunit alpha-like [Styela clava]|uniref:inhibitor of nuclear factor kappa-B kinase subunit alpha-like n=1 Tax=Styela clava TaxID=7725 RepID=UPI00193AAF8C|nr:inhibitor of nuclear factor kappa-B kinase subunit alpha-like [Styela clava]